MKGKIKMYSMKYYVYLKQKQKIQKKYIEIKERKLYNLSKGICTYS